MKKGIFFLLLVCITLIAKAQRFKGIDSVIRLYEAQFQPEKLHLHYDKHLIKPGETVWFKAYLLSGTQPITKSTNLYVDFYSQSGKLLQHTIWPINKANAMGSFMVPATYKEQLVQVKAYTAWMRNFDNSFMYRYQLRMLDSTAVAPSSQVKSKAGIRFYPEGGSIVADAPVNMAFQISNQFQQPMSGSGWILSSTGDTATSFATEHDGMGKCSFKHILGNSYTAVWTDETGVKHSTALPEAADLPAVMHTVVGEAVVRYTVFAKDKMTKARYHLAAYMHQQLVYRASFSLNGGDAKIAEIPINQLPSGVLQLTLFDDALVPVAERVVFVHGQDQEIQADIVPKKINTRPRAQNSLTLFLPDTVNGSYSIAVTDAVRPADSSYGIMSQLLLAADLRGYVHHADWYFRDDYLQKRAQLDLLMLTHGWRKYDWEKIKALALPEIKVPAEEHYLQLKGKLTGFQSGDLSAKDQVNLIISGKDSSKQMLALAIDNKAMFQQDDLIFFDTATVYYGFSKNKRLEQSALVQFSNGFSTTDTVIAAAILAVYPDKQLAEALLNRLAEERRAALLAKDNTLEEVTVQSKIKSRLDELNNTYVQNGLFSDPSSERVFDVMNDSRALSSLNVMQYLKGMVAGLNIQEDMMNGATVRWRGDPTALFLNEMQVSAKILETIPMTDIALVKTFRPPFMGAPLGGSGGAIAVYTKKGAKAESGTLFNESLPGLMKAKLAGYSVYKEFSSPDYTVFNNAEQKDIRPTLYWDPMIVTDNLNRKVEIRFFNNDVTKSFRVVLEGMNEAGKLVRVEKLLNSDQLNK